MQGEREKLVAAVTQAVLKQLKLQHSEKALIPLGISNRHVHLSAQDLATLFGSHKELTKVKDLSQPGQFACEEKVTLVGPKGVLEGVRVLGPVRKKTQVEISITDGYKLGIQAPIRDSGDLEGSAKITIVGPQGSVTIEEGCIVAARHIHMDMDDAARFGVTDGQRVAVKCPGERGGILFDVLIRVSENYRLEMHLDTDEANALALKNGDLMEIVEFCPQCPVGTR